MGDFSGSEYGLSSDDSGPVAFEPIPDPDDSDNSSRYPYELKPKNKRRVVIVNDGLGSAHRVDSSSKRRAAQSYLDDHDGPSPPPVADYLVTETDDHHGSRATPHREVQPYPEYSSDSSMSSTHVKLEARGQGSSNATYKNKHPASTARRSEPAHRTRQTRLIRNVPENTDKDGENANHFSEDESFESLRRKIEELNAELDEAKRRPEAPTPPPAVPSYRWRVFHCIRDRSGSSQRMYLEEPQWVPGESFIPELEAHAPIRNLDHYIEQHPEIAFAFYRDYHSDAPADRSKIETKDGVFRKAEPDKESLSLIASDMIEALNKFTAYLPRFEQLFPGFDASREISAPYLFAYYGKSYVEKICGNLDTIQATLIRLLMRAIDENYGIQYSRADAMKKNGLTTKDLMPYLVKPGDILVSPDGSLTRAYLATSWLSYHDKKAVEPFEESSTGVYDDPLGFKQTRSSQANETKKHVHRFAVKMWSYSFDGAFEVNFEKQAFIEIVSAYDDDEVYINTLNLFPLTFAANDMHDMLNRRGKMFWKCRHRRLVTHAHESESHLTNMNDRYMVDMLNCRKLFPKLFSNSRLQDDIGPRAMLRDDPPSRKAALLFPPTLIGYNLRTKRCQTLLVDKIKDVQWNKKAFEHLVVEPDTKELVQALVTNQLEVEQTTDPISGKGGGLILLLHGSPGTGKTFTAEGVAEFAEKPLLRVTCGHVGLDPHKVEKYLQRCFRLGKMWDCVVLLDEADVFLEERDVKDLNRNALVSVFLRVLEYYQGILILTSNRVGTFDEAFKSRIQLALHYENLTYPQRRKIWRNFMDRLRDMDDANIDFNDIIDNVEELGRADMNGREIRNVITTARQLAKYKQQKLSFVHLKNAIEVGGRFARYLKEVNCGDTDDVIKREGGIR